MKTKDDVPEIEVGSIISVLNSASEKKCILVTALLVATAGLAGMLEEAFADETAVDRVQGDRLEKRGKGGE